MRYLRIILTVLISTVFLALVVLLALYWWHEKRWTYIIVHHSAFFNGNLEYLREIHMTERGWPDIAYHFVIDNGSMGTYPGQIEESGLWKSRSHHYSTSNRYSNYFGIAIVLIGNFERQKLYGAQKESLLRLLTDLSKKYGIKPENIIGHKDINPTACPGKNVDLSEIREQVRNRLFH